MSQPKLVILGGGGHAHSVADVVLAADPDRELVFVDPQAGEGATIFGFPVVHETPDENDAEYFVAVGDNIRRRKLIDELAGKKLAKVIAPDAHIGTDATIGEAAFIGHEAYIGPEVHVGNGTIVNTRSILEHEVKIGEYSSITPAVTIAGRCKIGGNVFVGLGARIIDQLSVCDNVVIGAGAVVVDEITEPGTYVGIPAKKIHGA
jgi:UDP-N-acetylbacillosamine N-acetyltransferase